MLDGSAQCGVYVPCYGSGQTTVSGGGGGGGGGGGHSGGGNNGNNWFNPYQNIVKKPAVHRRSLGMGGLLAGRLGLEIPALRAAIERIEQRCQDADRAAKKQRDLLDEELKYPPLPRIPSGDDAPVFGPADLLIELIEHLNEGHSTSNSEQDENVQVFRVVGPEEAGDIANSRVYRNPPGLEGKYFFTTQEQAENLAGMYNKAGIPGPYTLTSGTVSAKVLDSAEKIMAAGEGQGYFFRSPQLPFIKNVVIHGIVP